MRQEVKQGRAAALRRLATGTENDPPEHRRAGWRLIVLLAVLVLIACIGGTASGQPGAPHADDLELEQALPAPSGVAGADVVITGTVPPGPRSVAVVMLNFASGPSEPWTADEARAAIFTGPGSVNAFEQEQSFGAISLTGRLRGDGDVFGWYTIAASTATCDPDAWMSAAGQAAAAAGVTLSGYQHRIYLFPRVAACGWAGAADLPGADSFINGTLSTRVIAHELGHNLGAHHASTLSCTDAGARVAYSAACTTQEYGDPFDVMGASARHSTAVVKSRYGFIPAANLATVSASGSYVLRSSSLAGAGPQSLRIGRGSASEHWYLELRSPAGAFDNFSPSDPAVTGVTVRLATDALYGSRTRLVDTTPATATFADAPLQAGQAFTDPLTGITIRVESVGFQAAGVRVDLAGAPPQAVPPPAASPVPAPRGAIVARRVSGRRVVVRVSMPAGSARRCLALVAGPWTPCRIVAGRTSFARVVAPRAGGILVAVRLDGDLALVRRIRVPRLGATSLARVPLRSIRALRP